LIELLVIQSIIPASF